MSYDNSILANVELMDSISKHVGSEFDRFSTDRDDIEAEEEVADNMYQCMQNRALEKTERSKGAVTAESPRAQTGSVIFHRMVNQSAAMGSQIVVGAEAPWKYRPIYNEAVFGSEEVASALAEQLNSLARWNLKKDRFKERWAQFFHQVRKYGNVPIMRTWKTDEREVAVREKGAKSAAWKRKKMSYFSWEILDNDMLYADRYGGPLEKQPLVILRVAKPLHIVKAQAASFDKTAWDDVLANISKYTYDGSEGQDRRKDREEARGRDEAYSGQTKMLVWNVYIQAPVLNGKWDEKNPAKLYWLQAVGNSISGAKWVSAQVGFDPDGEIPIKMVHAIMDDEDMLYHATPAAVSRSIYSTVCTMMNLAIDNMANINDPKRLVSDDAFLTANMDSKVWHCSGSLDNAVKEFTQQFYANYTLDFVRQLEQTLLMSSGFDMNSAGMAFGARTSATEAMQVNRATMTAALAPIRYVIDQALPWLGYSMRRYWEAYGDPRQVQEISNAPYIGEITKGQLWGDFDIEVSVVDEFEQNQSDVFKMERFMAMLGQSPAFQRSQTHRVDMGEALRSLGSVWKIPGIYRIVRPITDEDARYVQNKEIENMLSDGKYLAPTQGENHDGHIAVLDPVIRDLEGREETEAALKLLMRHREEHKAMRQQDEAQNQAAVSAGGGTMPAAAGAATPGEMSQQMLGETAGAA